jgi:hypothetical protein
MFREPSLCRHVRRELLRNAWLDFTPILPQLLAIKAITSRHTVGLMPREAFTNAQGQVRSFSVYDPGGNIIPFDSGLNEG